MTTTTSHIHKDVFGKRFGKNPDGGRQRILLSDLNPDYKGGDLLPRFILRQTTADGTREKVGDFNVTGSGGDMHIIQVGHEKRKWRETNGNEDIVQKIDDMGLANLDKACFPRHGIRDAKLYGVALTFPYGGRFIATEATNGEPRAEIKIDLEAMDFDMPYRIMWYPTYSGSNIFLDFQVQKNE